MACRRRGSSCQAKTSRLEGTLNVNSQQLQRMEFQSGFIAALDQSGGSTPRALALYGVPEDSYSGDGEMFDLMHKMRSRIVTSPSFGADRILAAILFEDTLERQFDGCDAADYLWRVKNVLTFLKVDKGLAKQVDGVRMMQPLPIWMPPWLGPGT